MKHLFLLRGLPGSSKSTLAKSIGNVLTGRIEADMYFNVNGNYVFDPSKLKEAHEWCKGVVENWMENPADYLEQIIVSNTFIQEWEMKPYYELAEKYGYTVFSLVVENRHGGVNEHGVPDETLDKMEKRFEIKLK